MVCVCTTDQNTILLVDALNWEVTYKDIVNKVVCDPSNCEVLCILILTVQEQTQYIFHLPRDIEILGWCPAGPVLPHGGKVPL